MSFDNGCGGRWRGYYITAYGLAVKHGFTGTEEEWLESLVGEDGKSVDIRYNEETNTLQWRHQDAEEEEWADLLDISTLQTQIVAETLADANAATIAAEQANTQAQGAKQSSAASAGQAADSAVQAKGSADAALESATAAAKSEQSAKEYAGKPPIVQGDTWHTWNAESQSYTDTGSKVSLTPKGEYSPDTAYTALDVVSDGGSSWMALKDVTGVAPAEGENWMLLAQKGDQGEQGIQGIQGIQGETGGPGPTGPQGASFTRLEKTAGTGAPGTTDTYTAYNSEGQAAGTVQVYNGMDGTGAGDFKADGTVPMTGNLQMAQHRVTGVADATEDGDAVNKGQMDAALEGVTVTTDAAPTEDSTNPVQSGGVYTALAGKADLTLSNLSNYQKALAAIGGKPRDNLLDNAYFKGGGSQQGGGQFPINQRGLMQYSGIISGIDRWNSGLRNGSSLTLNQDGIDLTADSIEAYIEEVIENFDTLSGKTVTLSCMYSGALGNLKLYLYRNDYEIPINLTLEQSDGINVVSGTVTLGDLSGVTRFFVRLTSIGNGDGTPTRFYAAKLEIGDTQTLAYQDEEGNWQLFETPDYGEELAKCQRYLFNPLMGGLEWSQIMYGYAYSDTAISCTLTLPVNMRTLPAIIQSGDFRCVGAGIVLEATGFNVVDCSGNTIRIDVSVSGAKASEVYVFMRDNDSASKLLLSAEL